MISCFTQRKWLLYLSSHDTLPIQTTNRVPMYKEFFKLEMIVFRLIKTGLRLTFDIISQHPRAIYQEGDKTKKYLYHWTATNGSHVISYRHIDMWHREVRVRGFGYDERSATMEFDTNEERDKAYLTIIEALGEWSETVYYCAIETWLEENGYEVRHDSRGYWVVLGENDYPVSKNQDKSNALYNAKTEIEYEWMWPGNMQPEFLKSSVTRVWF